MASNKAISFENPSILCRLFGVINILGTYFCSLRSVVDSVFCFVTAGSSKEGHDEENDDGSRLCGFIDNLNFMHPDIFSEKDMFTTFNEYCITKGLSHSTVFVSQRDLCRYCSRKLTTCPTGKEVVVYHMTRGTYLVSRFTKNCQKCRVQEHYGFYIRAKGFLIWSV